MARRFSLTRREVQVLVGLASGDTRAAVAAGLGVSVWTVDFHLRNLYRKLGCHSGPRVVYLTLTYRDS